MIKGYSDFGDRSLLLYWPTSQLPLRIMKVGVYKLLCHSYLDCLLLMQPVISCGCHLAY